jgi:hypothetical protein
MKRMNSSAMDATVGDPEHLLNAQGPDADDRFATG